MNQSHIEYDTTPQKITKKKKKTKKKIEDIIHSPLPKKKMTVKKKKPKPQKPQKKKIPKKVNKSVLLDKLLKLLYS